MVWPLTSRIWHTDVPYSLTLSTVPDGCLDACENPRLDGARRSNAGLIQSLENGCTMASTRLAGVGAVSLMVFTLDHQESMIHRFLAKAEVSKPPIQHQADAHHS